MLILLSDPIQGISIWMIGEIKIIIEKLPTEVQFVVLFLLLRWVNSTHCKFWTFGDPLGCSSVRLFISQTTQNNYLLIRYLQNGLTYKLNIWNDSNFYAELDLLSSSVRPFQIKFWVPRYLQSAEVWSHKNMWFTCMLKFSPRKFGGDD